MSEGPGWNDSLQDDEATNRTARDAALRALIPAHALGATDSDEAAAIEELIGRDPAAAAEFAAYRPLRNALLYGAQPVLPPPALEARLRAATQPPLAPVVFAQTQRAPAAASAARRPVAPQGWRRWFAPATRPAWALAGAALALLVVTNLWWGLQARQLRVAQIEAERMQASAAAARAAAEAEIAEYDSMIAALAMGQAETAMLPAGGAAPSADTHAMVIWKPGESSGMVMAEGFPPLKPGEVYQVWLLHGEDRMSGGMFYVDDKGSGMVMFESPMPLESLDGVGITMEPAGGSAAPTSDPVVRGTI